MPRIWIPRSVDSSIALALAVWDTSTEPMTESRHRLLMECKLNELIKMTDESYLCDLKSRIPELYVVNDCDIVTNLMLSDHMMGLLNQISWTEETWYQTEALEEQSFESIIGKL